MASLLCKFPELLHLSLAECDKMAEEVNVVVIHYPKPEKIQEVCFLWW
jgi:hypothetical protein